MGVDYEMPYTLGQTWYYFLFFVPGLVAFYYGSHFLQPLWSIGVEEVFYLFWAPLFKFGNRAILQILIMIVVLKSALEILDMTAIENPLFSYILATFKFEAMAIGGLGAYFLFYKGASLTKSILFKVPAQILIFGIIAVYIIFHCNIKSIVWDFFFKTPIISSLFLDFLFLYAILCISVIHNSIIKWRGKVLSFLGEISYGIYMYHMLAIFTVMFFLKKFLVNHPDLLGHIVFYFCVTFLVIGLSTFSKLFFEDYFLRLKKKIEIH
jgi:peptidoglycan/LPS O-acetylase OafA/YrhL